MRVLGMDTATSATTVAVWNTETGTVLERRDDPPVGARPRHTTRLLALAAQALADAGTDWAGVDLYAVGTGPGTFTGIRIGVATARALASARGTPIVGVSTLRALASGAVGAPPDQVQAPSAVPAAPVTPVPAVLAVLDARRREVFAAGWSTSEIRDPGAPARLIPRALAPGALAHLLAQRGERWLAVGEGAVQSRTLLQAAGAIVPADASPRHRLDATEICRLALGLTPRTPDEIHPEYLRLPDAELSRRAAAARPSRPS
jgi:tRNA threonylcarbamoyladenosine biosynthesis protein TsaB